MDHQSFTLAKLFMKSFTDCKYSHDAKNPHENHKIFGHEILEPHGMAS